MITSLLPTPKEACSCECLLQVSPHAPSLSIVYYVHLHSIDWWCSWVLQRLQIFGFPSCNVVMKKLHGMVMLVFFLNIVCQTWGALDSSFQWYFFTTNFLHLCSFFASKSSQWTLECLGKVQYTFIFPIFFVMFFLHCPLEFFN